MGDWGMWFSVAGVVRKRNARALQWASRFPDTRMYIVNKFTSTSRLLSRREFAMRFTLLTTLAAFTAVACGGDKKSAASQAEAATPTPAATSAATASAE